MRSLVTLAAVALALGLACQPPAARGDAPVSLDLQPLRLAPLEPAPLALQPLRLGVSTPAQRPATGNTANPQAAREMAGPYTGRGMAAGDASREAGRPYAGPGSADRYGVRPTGAEPQAQPQTPPQKALQSPVLEQAGHPLRGTLGQPLAATQPQPQPAVVLAVTADPWGIFVLPSLDPAPLGLPSLDLSPLALPQLSLGSLLQTSAASQLQGPTGLIEAERQSEQTQPVPAAQPQAALPSGPYQPPRSPQP